MSLRHPVIHNQYNSKVEYAVSNASEEHVSVDVYNFIGMNIYNPLFRRRRFIIEAVNSKLTDYEFQ